MRSIIGMTSVLCLAAGACTVQSAEESGEDTSQLTSALVRGPNGQRTTSMYPLLPGATTFSTASDPPPAYGGGPLLTNVKIVSVMWGPNVRQATRDSMGNFYGAITNSRFLDVADEYSTTTRLMGRGTLIQSVTITPNNTSATLLDSDIQNELATQINQQKLPVADGNTLYQIHFPASVTKITEPFGGVSCVNFCAYHWVANVTVPPGRTFKAPYSVLPDQGPCGCGQALSDFTAIASHEMMEAMTDPQPFTGWSPEIGDPSACQTQRVTVPTSSGQRWGIQPMWSNTANGCVSAPPMTVGVFRAGTQDEWLLRSSNTHGNPNFDFLYGANGDIPVVGDWDGSNESTMSVYRPSTNQWFLRTSNTAGGQDIPVFAYGGTGDIPVVGDWDGDGKTTIGVYRPSTNQWLLRNSNTAGGQDIAVFAYGGTGDVPVVGDWDGDGKTTIGVYRPSTNQWLLRNSNTAGGQDIAVFAYGGTGDVPVVGDWDGDGKTTIGVYRPVGSPLNGGTEAVWLMRNTNNFGNPDIQFTYGGAGDKPVVGAWRRHL